MSVDAFLSFEGTIKGESKDPIHKEEIDILSWSWGLTNPSDFSGGGRRTAVRVNQMNLKKNVDKSSPVLFQYCYQAKRIPTAVLSIRKAGKRPLDYVKIKLSQVYITGINILQGEDDDELVKESVSLAFAGLDMEYSEQKDDGSGKAPVIFQFDRSQ